MGAIGATATFVRIMGPTIGPTAITGTTVRVCYVGELRLAAALLEDTPHDLRHP